MSEIEKAMNFMDKHFIKMCILFVVMCMLLGGASCYNFNKALDKYNEKNKVENSK